MSTTALGFIATLPTSEQQLECPTCLDTGGLMPDNEEVLTQQRLLRTHRQTLAFYLEQQAKLGSAYTTPATLHGILEAREGIQRIKHILRAWDIQVEDLPDDTDTTYKSPIRPVSTDNQDETRNVQGDEAQKSVNNASTSVTTIESADGSEIAVLSNELEFGFFSGYGMTWIKALPISSGITVAFEKMKVLEIVNSIDVEGEYNYTKSISVKITLINNRVVEAKVIKSRPHLQGSTDLGPLSIGLKDVKRIIFPTSEQ